MNYYDLGRARNRRELNNITNIRMPVLVIDVLQKFTCFEKKPYNINCTCPTPPPVLPCMSPIETCSTTTQEYSTENPTSVEFHHTTAGTLKQSF